MRLAREMKDSGIEWIGEIPKDWTTSRLKALFAFGKGLPITKDNLISEGLPVISYGQIHSKQTSGVAVESHLIKYVSENYMESNPQSLVNKGDFIFADTSEDLDGCGNCVYIDREMPLFAGYHTIIFRHKKSNNNKFLAYLFKTDAWRTQLRAKASGVKLFSVSRKMLSESTVIFPSEKEQQKIADFLDTKCSTIDSTITDTQASIEEYKKLKQAIITEAVTRGIRGDRPMKDSGIDCMGEIPVDWMITKTHYCLKMPITDGPHTTPDLYDEGIPFISAEAVSCGNGKIDFSHMRGFISEEFYKECCKKYKPEINDIYMIKSGATTGKVAMVETSIRFNIWSPLAVFRCKDNILKHRFLFYFLQSQPYQKQVELGWTYGTQQNIGMGTLEMLKLVVPPLTEQQEIADYLDQKCSAIDQLIKDKEQLITELEAYKKTLIYDYITGKKEVC